MSRQKGSENVVFTTRKENFDKILKIKKELSEADIEEPIASTSKAKTKQKSKVEKNIGIKKCSVPLAKIDVIRNENDTNSNSEINADEILDQIDTISDSGIAEDKENVYVRPRKRRKVKSPLEQSSSQPRVPNEVNRKIVPVNTIEDLNSVMYKKYFHVIKFESEA